MAGKNRKLFAFIVAALTVAVMIPSLVFADTPEYKDGTYKGTQWGYSSDITVEVTIKDGKMESVQVTEQDETPIYWELVVDESGSELLNKVVETQSTAVDAVSGATISSMAVLGAIDQALAKAAGLDTAVTEPQKEWFAGGDGTSEDPFRIATAEQLYKVASTVNGDIRYKDAHLALTNDIDLTGVIWRPIGSNSFPFAGHFDGRGHVIRNLSMGTSAKERYAARSNSRHLGLFGMLDQTALIENVTVENAVIYAEGEEASVRTGLIAGQTKGGIIRNVSASGLIDTISAGGNDVAGGIVGYLNGGALINAQADVDVTSVCKASDNYDEAGGLAGMNNAALIANCAAYGSVTADGKNLIASALVGEQCGDVVNCVAGGNLTTLSKTGMAGMVSGDIDGGRTYNCWYKDTAVMTNGGEPVNPASAIGATYAKVMDYPGTYYIGNMTQNLNTYNVNDIAKLAEELNESFKAFPIDITAYGIGDEELLFWGVDGVKPAFAAETAKVTYARPEAEVIPQVEQEMKDGVWYGRDAEKTAVVKVTTEKNAVVKTESVSGATSGDAFDAAVAKACEKAIYGDTSDYEAADTARFAGGSGTKEDPYLIADEAQLRYIAEAVNEDVTWENVWFRQTKDIQLSGKEWLPIGYSVFGYWRSRWIAYATYPFLGNYDGGGFIITGMHIGSKAGSGTDPRSTYTAGMFGVVKGTVSQNYPLDKIDGAVQRNISNVNLKDVLINVKNENGLYAGALIAQPGNGFKVDGCSAQGSITAFVENGNLYAGGLYGNGLRGGLIQNCVADVDVAASANEENSGTVYAGGFSGSENRVTTVNCAAGGDVSASAKAGRSYVGGFAGYCAGANYNVVAAGTPKALTETERKGALAGELAYIGAYYHASASKEAGLALYGKSNTTEDKDHGKLLTASEMNGEKLVADLNGAIKTVAAEMQAMQKAIGNDPIHSVYYTGDGNDLTQWTAGSKHVTLQGIPESVSAQNLTVKAKPQVFKVKALKKKAKSFKLTKALTVKGQKGKLSYTVKPVNKASKKAISYKSGKITVKKGAKKGTYKVKVTVKAAAAAGYSAAKKQTVLNIKVK